MIELPRQIHDAMVAHAVFCAPYEACGLLAVGDGGALHMVYCLTNADRSRRRFTVVPQEHFAAMQHAERHGWLIGGVFHSHPGAAARPSAVDIAAGLDPTWLHFIVGPLPDPEVRAFHIRSGAVFEVPLSIT